MVILNLTGVLLGIVSIVLLKGASSFLAVFSVVCTRQSSKIVIIDCDLWCAVCSYVEPWSTIVTTNLAEMRTTPRGTSLPTLQYLFHYDHVHSHSASHLHTFCALIALYHTSQHLIFESLNTSLVHTCVSHIATLEHSWYTFISTCIVHILLILTVDLFLILSYP